MAKFTAITTQTKNKHNIRIRSVEKSEAIHLLEAFRAVAKSSPFILTTAEDAQKVTLEEEEKVIESHEVHPTGIFIIAEDLDLNRDNKIVAMVNCKTYRSSKMNHVAALGISCLDSHQGIGLGKILMKELINWAQSTKHIKVLELSVMSANEHAIALYKKMGFVVEGVKKNRFKFLNQLTGQNIECDDICMALYF